MLDPSIFIFLLKRKQYPEKDIPNGVHYWASVFISLSLSISLCLSFFLKQQF